MLFNSAQFLVFFPIVVLLYFVCPDKLKNYLLLVASYYFYMCWNAEYALLILTTTIITFGSGMVIEKAKEADNEKRSKAKLAVAVSFILNIGILFYFKYTNFALGLMGGLLNRVGVGVNIPVFDIVLPVGISFYTFQALSYTMDVYRGDIYAEKNFFKYALFVSFFPQLVAGPIERSKNLLKQLQPHKFNYEDFRDGFLLMLWGYFLKLVLADRIAIFVDTVYKDYDQFGGMYIVVATMLFAVQIYCDFAGYSVIAMGAAQILGIRLMENFDAPYLSTNVAEFWRRWHISLTSWFRDYLYIPLGGSRKGKLRKYINIMIVFLVSGLWHGASLSFVLWGGLNGLYQVIGSLLMPIRDKLRRILGISKDKIGYKVAGAIITFALVDFAWLFFRADSLSDAFAIVRQIFAVRNPWILFDHESLYQCGLSDVNFRMMLIAIFILFVADLCKRKGIVIRKVILEQDYWVRWIVIPVIICFILVFGIWGPSYNEANFIYFQF
ncbi:MBOAT family O-acyltransferase [Butyrivibrio sp. VCB2006]|uniref:MBOAT family O-acyltransferase n=1 Tax=Butyrivibrio sp. VCB2006 TaxID=1280679 RepID=UPI0004282370|nr:MBOAT family O-acyltransferase [Butyrivibrio sp. VCB2006]